MDDANIARDVVKTALANARAVNLTDTLYSAEEIDCTKVILVNCIAYLNRAIGRDAVKEIIEKAQEMR